MAWRIGRIPFPVVLGIIAGATLGLFLLGYRWDNDLGGALLVLIPLAFAGVYLWDAARLDRDAERARAAAAPVAAPRPDPAPPGSPPTDDEPFEDPVEEADRLESESRSAATDGDAAP